MADSEDLELKVPTVREVADRRQELFRRLQSEILRIEEEIAEGRDDGWVDDHGVRRAAPIYLTKGRVKSEESIYLKMRRKAGKKYDLQSITDYVGLRVLVMFDDDLPGAMTFLLGRIIQAGLLIEVTFFNMTHETQDTDWIVEINTILEKHRAAHPAMEVKWVSKDPGYRSIHFVFGRRLYGVNRQFPQFSEPGIVPVELQLRTLLQDVWAEMEHKLSYKQGKSDGDIVAEFRDLQADILTMGNRLAKIKSKKDVNERNNAALLSGSPLHDYFNYEDQWNIEAAISPSRSELLLELKEYHRLVGIARGSPASSCDFAPVLGQLERLERAFEDAKGAGVDCMVLKYFFMMERAYILFHQKEFDQALTLYDQVRKCQEFEERPVPHFRYGEILYVRGRHEDLLAALDAFDHAIALVGKQTPASGKFDVTRQYSAGILTKVAAVYEDLGSGEYLDYCILLLRKALKLVEDVSIEDELPANYRYNYANNLGWCLVEKFRCASGPSEKVDGYRECLEVLSPIIDGCLKDPVEQVFDRKNFLDTVAWFLFQTYLYTGQPGGSDALTPMLPCRREEMLSHARRLVNRMDALQVNHGPFPKISNSRQGERQRQIRGRPLRT